MTLKIILPQKVSSNAVYAGTHWAVRKRIADDYHEAVWIAVKEAGWRKGKLKLTFHVSVVYKFFLPGKQLDISNLGMMCKLIEDGLVREGVLPDDGPEYVKEITLSSGRAKTKVAYVEVGF